MKKHYFIVLISIVITTTLNAKDFNIIDYGAKPDTSLNSAIAIQSAIDACSEQGGGKVIIPTGEYMTGTIILKSNTDLYLERGAILYGSRNLEDYKPMKPDYVSLRTQDTTVQLIYAENVDNVGISGFGEINGRGKGFIKKERHDEGISRPHLIRFITCKNINVENVTLKNSACWMQHYLACDDVQIKDIRVYNHSNYNNDAIDIDGCKNVIISGVMTDTDDDGITLKSTSPRPCENIVINNCVISSHCNAIKAGTESNGGFKNIVISNCVVKPSSVSRSKYYGSFEGISGISLEMVDGGILKGVTISNIVIEGTLSPLFIRLGNRARTYKEGLLIKNVGSLSDVSITNIRVLNTTNIGCSITGIPGYSVSNINLSNISMEFAGGGTEEDIYREIPEKEKEYLEAKMFGVLPAYGFYIRHAKNISFDNVTVDTKNDKRPAFYLDDVELASLNKLKLTSYENNVADIFLKKTNNVVIEGSSIKGKSTCFVRLQGDNQHVSIYNNNLVNAEKVYSKVKDTPGTVNVFGNIQKSK